jgi:hypothetical protein
LQLRPELLQQSVAAASPSTPQSQARPELLQQSVAAAA